MKRMGLVLGLLVACVQCASAGDVVERIDTRFKDSESEQPDFRRHVVPLMGKLGCNGRACHGSFQGQGDFRLSLFGYDFKMDHDGLTGGDKPRVNVDAPDKSLALRKPSSDDIHEGGQRFDQNSWEHHVLRAWIRHGAAGHTPGAFELKALKVSPSEIQFAAKDEKLQLRVLAEWTDGVVEDVTPLCRFKSNSSQVATIDETGLITAADPGDTHIVVFFDSGVVPIPVLRPVSKLAGKNFPKVSTPTKIDTLVVAKLRKLGVVPSGLSSDTEFLRRVRLDITGTLPTAAEVEAFINDTATDKRSRKIDDLLESPAYAAWWTTRICDMTGNNDSQLNNVLPSGDRSLVSKGWFDWVYKRLANNTPYDEIAKGILLGTSRDQGEDYRKFCENMSAICRSEGDLADRESMPYFWARTELRRSSEARSIAVAYSFMGIRIQCAQCHKHPFDQWTQNDFKEFSKFFSTVTFNRNPQAKTEYAAMLKELGIDKLKGGDQRRKLRDIAKEGKTVPFSEVFAGKAKADAKKTRGKKKVEAKPVTARVLGGETYNLSSYDDPRQAFVEWLMDKQNPYFARAIVNRVWSNYFNVGIVEPPDDMSLANPPSNQALLDYLTDGFVARKFDLKWLHREIANSHTYQASWKPTETNRNDLVNFSHSIPRRLAAEIAYDAVRQATSADEVVASLNETCENRAITMPGVATRSNSGLGYALQVFGRSTRESNCDCDRSSDSSLLQTVYLQNDEDVLAMIESSRDSWLRQIASQHKLQINPPTTNSNAARQRLQRTVSQLQKRYQAAKKAGDKKTMARYQRQIQAAKKRAKGGSATGEEPEQQQLAKADTQALIRQAYLRTLSRYPTPEELQKTAEYIAGEKNALNGLRDVLWALVNTKEFIVNR